jgi:hypothetical protein
VEQVSGQAAWYQFGRHKEAALGFYVNRRLRFRAPSKAGAIHLLPGIRAASGLEISEPLALFADGLAAHPRLL